jgi:putative membrane protein
MSSLVHLLPHVNASLNALATVLLLVGYWQIKRRQELAHKWTMLACFSVSIVFLTCYVTYHLNIEGGSKRFPAHPPLAARYFYYAILLTHVILAAAVPFLAVGTIWLGLADRRQAHVRLARWTFPIWLYVSVTGVIVYLMLYQIYPPLSTADKIGVVP